MEEFHPEVGRLPTPWGMPCTLGKLPFKYIMKLNVSLNVSLKVNVSCRGRQTANTLESNKRCEKAETECEDSLEKEQLVRLPSTGRFEDRFSHCQAAFDLVCIGPAHTGQVQHQASSLPFSCIACPSRLPVYHVYRSCLSNCVCWSVVFACLLC